VRCEHGTDARRPAFKLRCKKCNLRLVVVVVVAPLSLCEWRHAQAEGALAGALRDAARAKEMRRNWQRCVHGQPRSTAPRCARRVDCCERVVEDRLKREHLVLELGFF
jgi:hypothetical protein